MSGVGVVAFQARASKVFYRCSAAAQDAGVEEVFMAKFNSIAGYGDSLDSTILRWGARRIKRMYDEVAPKE